MAFITGLLQVIAALPKLIELVTGFIGFVEKKFGPDWPKVIADLNDAFNKLEKAKTVEERLDAARSLQGAIGKL